MKYSKSFLQQLILTNWISMCCFVIHPETVGRHRNSKIISTYVLCTYFLWIVFPHLFLLLTPTLFLIYYKKYFPSLWSLLWYSYDQDLYELSGQSLPKITTLRFSFRLLSNHQACWWQEYHVNCIHLISTSYFWASLFMLHFIVDWYINNMFHLYQWNMWESFKM